jgi:hypothetical protein
MISRMAKEKEMAKSWDCEPWAKMYRVAMLEMDDQRVPGQIESARSAIVARIGELESRKESVELGSLFNALKMLSLLQGVLQADGRCNQTASHSG